MGGNIVSSVVQLGDRPRLDRLIGAVKVLMDEYLEGRVDEIHIFSTSFVNTMKQEPRQIRIVPIPEEYRTAAGELRTSQVSRRRLGLHLRARRARTARRHDAALPRSGRSSRW